MVPAGGTGVTAEVHIVFEDDAQPVTGTLTGRAGAERFVGWLNLLAALERARPPAAPGPPSPAR